MKYGKGGRKKTKSSWRNTPKWRQNTRQKLGRGNDAQWRQGEEDAKRRAGEEQRAREEQESRRMEEEEKKKGAKEKLKHEKCP